MGPSGVGKSTLLAFVAGFLGPDFRAEGRIVLNGRDVTALPAAGARASASSSRTRCCSRTSPFAAIS